MTVKFGIIGLGRISTRFATVLNTMEGVELTSVAARDQARADAFTYQFNAKKAYHRYLDVITDDKVDIVYIGLTNNLHYQFTRTCLEHHKAVLCEKPLVTTRKEAESLVDLAQTNRTLLVEGLWTRCLPAFQKARSWVNQGRLGQVQLITASFCFKADYEPEGRLFNRELAGGSLFDVGVYPISFATGILSSSPATVTGLANISASGVDEFSALSMSFPNGTLANLSCGFTVDVERTARIYGTMGKVVLDSCFNPRKCELFDEKDNLIESFTDPVQDGFAHQIRHCADLFSQGKIESDLIPWQDTIACAGIIDDLRSQWGVKL